MENANCHANCVTGSHARNDCSTQLCQCAGSISHAAARQLQRGAQVRRAARQALQRQVDGAKQAQRRGEQQLIAFAIIIIVSCTSLGRRQRIVDSG